MDIKTFSQEKREKMLCIKSHVNSAMPHMLDRQKENLKLDCLSIGIILIGIITINR